MTQTPTEAPSPAAEAAPKGLKAKLKLHLLHPDLTAEQVALSFALGFGIALNPLLGLHTWMAALCCLTFRKLHRPLVFLVSLTVNNPGTLVPIATASAFLGNLLMGRGLKVDLGSIRWKELGLRNLTTHDGFMEAGAMLKPILAPYLLGGMVLSALGLFAGYYAMVPVVRRLRALHLPHLHRS